MTKLSSKTVLVYDYGQYVELAATLSKQFGRTLYFAPWVGGGSPTSHILRIGQGLEGVERVDEIWPHIDEVDLFVFPDAYEPAFQEYLVSLGKRVWGCRAGAELELDRIKSKQISKKLGIDIAPYEVVKGVDALRGHLKKHDDQWVKISTTRGDMETFHAPDYEHVEQTLDRLAADLGPKKNIMEFVVEQGIEPAVECGYDGYTVDGRFPNGALVGVETKGKAYFGKTMRYGALPKQVRSVNEMLAPALKRYGCRGFISAEIRCKGDRAYLIDPCMRCGSPPSELYQGLIENLAEVLFEGADGILVEPEYSAKFGAMIMLTSEWVANNWLRVSFPDEIRENVKLHNMTVLDGEHYVIPHSDRRQQLGAVVAMGDTAQSTIDECKRLADLVEGHQIDKSVAALDEAKDDLMKLLGPQTQDSPSQRKADELRKSGKISEKQYDRMLSGA